MRIWLTNASEPLSYTGSTQRPMRTGLIAHTLQERGHDVIWWTSGFDHVRKEHRWDRDAILQAEKRLKIIAIYSPGYRRHVSLARLRDHYVVGRKFAAMAEKQPKPDLILSSLPILELCSASVRYGNRNNIPVVVDIRDWWPDIFCYVFPRWMHGIARIALHPFFSTAQAACSGATAITGITPAFVEWGIKKAQRTIRTSDKAFPLGYAQSSPSPESIRSAYKFWEERGIKQNKSRFIVCFVGSFGRALELKAVVETARRFKMLNNPALFVLCGNGESFEYYKTLSKSLDNVVFPGWVGGAEIYVLLRIAQVGLSPLPDRPDFTNSINNKTIEYLSAGLPIVSSPKKGAVFDLLLRHKCGRSYACEKAEELSSVLLELQQQPDEVGKMSANSKDLFNLMFVGERVYSQMAVYLEWIAETFPHG